MSKNGVLATATALSMMLSVSAVSAGESRRECELALRPLTNTAVGGGIGTVGGGIIGAAACSGFLGTVFFDLGLSYSICVASVALAASVAATAATEATNIEQRARCERLADR
jgi:hypothetical protein